ncbi:hypothetical protein [Candidatus Lokiarchaeum ossiferum]|uniref:hypothetical protein n=1 Tax=Candidatus Lokiarchaeum ossiferum TaxID=2951803 RepID=UPI00352E0C86
MSEEKLEKIDPMAWGKKKKSTAAKGKRKKEGAKSKSSDSTNHHPSPSRSKKFNLKLENEPENDAVMVAIMKYINLFKSPKFDKIRNPVYPIKQNLIKIALREKWMSKCQQCGKVQEHDVFMDFAIKLKSKFGNEFNNDFLNSGKCPKCFKETPEYKKKLATEE